MSPDKLSKANILAALDRLNELFHGKGVMGELCIFGGAVMILLQESPAAFRVRNLFVSANALHRA